MWSNEPFNPARRAFTIIFFKSEIKKVVKLIWWKNFKQIIPKLPAAGVEGALQVAACREFMLVYSSGFMLFD